MTATLATSTDPLLLIDGCPESLHADADHLDRQSRAFGEHVADLRLARPALWTGTAADGWTARRAQYVTAVETVGQIHAVTGAALRQHADTITWAHGRAEVAVRLYAQGCTLRDSEALTCTVGAPRGGRAVSGADDAGAGHRALAEDVLASARARVATSAQATAAVLDELSDGLPDGRWHLGDFGRGIWSWVTGIASLVWDHSAARALIDPDGVAEDTVALVDGVVGTWDGLTHDPLTTGAGLLQIDLLRDRPGEWWGQAAPDLAISAVSGGAGWAARGLRSARLAEDLGAAGGAGRRLYAAGSPWQQPVARAGWVDDWQATPEVRQAIRVPNSDWGRYQRDMTGTNLETKLFGGGDSIWADGLHLDPDTVVAVEVKHTGSPGASPYDGSSPFLRDKVMRQFDSEVSRYGLVIADEANPVARLRLIVSDQASADFLGARAGAILGPDVDLDVIVVPARRGE